MVVDGAPLLYYSVFGSGAVNEARTGVLDIGQRTAELPLAIKSQYYRGLLVLLRRDRVIDDREKALVLRIGELLGFDRRFCETAVGELLSNANITREPIVFTDQTIAEPFLRDALRLALVDGELHPAELSWLRRVAHANGLTDEWLESSVAEIAERLGAEGDDGPFDIERHLHGAE